jgi:hypothetical protein
LGKPLIKKEKYGFKYGRTYSQKRMNEMSIKLPAKDNRFVQKPQFLNKSAEKRQNAKHFARRASRPAAGKEPVGFCPHSNRLLNKSNKPDWIYMGRYIRSLPYSGNI